MVWGQVVTGQQKVQTFLELKLFLLKVLNVFIVQFLEGNTAASLGLTGYETYDINLSENPGIHDIVDIVARDESGEKRFKAMVRFDADADIRYYKNGGILPMVVRKKLGGA